MGSAEPDSKLDEYWEALVDGRAEEAQRLRGELDENDRTDSADLLKELNLIRVELGSESENSIPPVAARAASFSSSIEPGRVLGDYEIVRKIASGGVGTVFLARQKSIDRLVAFKLVKGGPPSDESRLKRIRLEAFATGRVTHPGIVPIFDTGEVDGMHFFSMEWIDGQNLSEALSDGTLDARRSAEYTVQICDAVAFAHEKGVIHRDLKPSNIMIDRDDRLRLTDFGMAKLTDAGLSSDSIMEHPTMTGIVVGTPNYMSPEQAMGLRSKVNEVSDVYSIGAVLYEMLTGRPPFRAENAVETMRQVVDNEPAPPRALNGKIPVDLETICLKCLSKESSRRYRSATEVGDECRRFLEGRPIQARPVSTVERLVRWSKKNKRLAVAWTVAATLLLATVVGSIAFAFVVGNKNEQIKSERAAAVSSQVAQILDAEPNAVLYASKDFADNPQILDGLQAELDDESNAVNRRLNAACALSMAGRPQTEFIVGNLEHFYEGPAVCKNVLNALAEDQAAKKSLRQVVESDAEKDIRFKAAILLAHLGDFESWFKLGANHEDQGDRTALIHLTAKWHGDFGALLNEARKIVHHELGWTVVQAIGLIDPESIRAEDRKDAIAWFRSLAKERHSDVLWSSAIWAMNHWNVPGSSEERSGARRMVRIEPVTIKLGRLDKKNLFPDAPGHEVTLTQAYWIGATEVTVGALPRVPRRCELS